MPTTPSPLRYPGGKTKLYKYVKSLIELNGMMGETYIEPFAGGSGLALKLLINNDVKRIVINDLDPAIYAFWYCVLNKPDEMCNFINTVSLTVDEWDKQRNIYLNQQNYTQLQLAQATLFLNRTNVSGVITGGVIGKRDQTGNYKMDARFKRDELVQKIRTISDLSDRIVLYNMDAVNFLQNELRHYYKAFINFDPPYVVKGGQLYKNSFSEADHRTLRDQIARCNRKWIVTYDVCDLVANLYSKFRGSTIDIYYSANGAKKEKEYIFFSNNMLLPPEALSTNSDA
ncbi:MAG: DNA adenine methylase [Clostridia bacterium]|nr:DNA adenine methylase [Clostridia bacterium]